MKTLSIKAKLTIITLVFLAGVAGMNAEAGLPDSSLAGKTNNTISVSEENASCVGVAALNFTYTLEDTSSKQLSVFVWYPVTALGSLDLAQCPCPLIILSHGFGGGTPLHFTYLIENLVKQGYIVAATIHEDSVYYPGIINLSPRAFWDRPLAAKAIIDRMLRLNNDWESIFYGTIDEEAIGVLGHSLGGWTAEVLCGAAPAGYEDCADPRIKAAIFFAPANMFLHTTGIGNVRVPSMSIFGAKDKIVLTSLNKFVYEQAVSPKYYAVIKDFGHSDYGDSGKDKPEADVLIQYTLSFFDRYLKDDFIAEETLQTSSPIFSAYEYENAITQSFNLHNGLTDSGTSGKGNLFGGLMGGGNPRPVSLQATALAADPSALDSPWQEIPAYGTELEAIEKWQETASSNNTTDNEKEEEISNDTSSKSTDSNSSTSGIGSLLGGLLGGNGSTGGMGNMVDSLITEGMDNLLSRFMGKGNTGNHIGKAISSTPLGRNVTNASGTDSSGTSGLRNILGSLIDGNGIGNLGKLLGSESISSLMGGGTGGTGAIGNISNLYGTDIIPPIFSDEQIDRYVAVIGGKRIDAPSQLKPDTASIEFSMAGSKTYALTPEEAKQWYAAGLSLPWGTWSDEPFFQNHRGGTQLTADFDPSKPGLETKYNLYLTPSWHSIIATNNATGNMSKLLGTSTIQNLR